jgi:hypothetical protein
MSSDEDAGGAGPAIATQSLRTATDGGAGGGEASSALIGIPTEQAHAAVTPRDGDEAPGTRQHDRRDIEPEACTWAWFRIYGQRLGFAVVVFGLIRSGISNEPWRDVIAAGSAIVVFFGGGPHLFSVAKKIVNALPDGAENQQEV